MKKSNLWFIASFIWGVVYAFFLQTRIGWLIDKEYTAIGVTGGVAGVLIIASQVLGYDATLFLLGCFSFAGGPMYLRMVRNLSQRHEQLQKAQERIR